MNTTTWHARQQGTDPAAPHVDAWIRALDDEPWRAEPEHYIDESDWFGCGEQPDALPWGADIFTSGAAHDHGVEDAADLTSDLRRLAARQYALFAQVLADAADCPDPWCGPDPTADSAWEDARGRSAARVRAERREIAVRAATADLAVRTRISEVTVRARAHDATLLRERCPRVWDAFAAGLVDERNAATVAGFAQTLPGADATGGDAAGADAANGDTADGRPVVWDEFDAQVVEAARLLPAGKFRVRARSTRERVYRESLMTRHARAREDRAVWLTNDIDGMATLSVYGPATAIHNAYDRVDQAARHLAAEHDENRTLAQLRTDVALDLLAQPGYPSSDNEDRGDDEDHGVAGGISGIGSGALHGAAAPPHTGPLVIRTAKPAVAITVPALTLLGKSDEPAILHGYGPIDLETARILAGDATGWVRILTHPVTGTTLDVDRAVYKVPKALRRWLGARDPVCAFPGCTRLARDCDIDHRIEWQHGGTTSAGNTGPLCRSHHRVKTESLWQVETDADTGGAVFSSPSGLVAEADPPPW